MQYEKALRSVVAKPEAESHYPKHKGRSYYSTPHIKLKGANMKYDLSHIMHTAWRLYRTDYSLCFEESLHRAWLVEKAIPVNAERIRTAKEQAGISEEVATWYEWKRRGYEVRHESKCLFQTTLIHASKGDNQTYCASFFGESQVQALA